MTLTCYHTGVMALMTPKCSVCGVGCGIRYAVTPKGEPLCSQHEVAPRCHMCQSVKKLITGPTIPICANCNMYSIVDNAGAMRVAQPVLDWFTTELGANRLSEVPLMVGSINTNAFPPFNLGHASLTQSGNHGWAEISLSSHQHESMLASTIAHEYGHVLLTFSPFDFTFHGDFNRDPLIDEGSCEVVRALWLEYSNTPDSRFLRKLMDSNSTPIYGDGFRMMWGEYQRIGSLKAFIEHVVNGGGVGLQPVPELFPAAPVSTLPEPHIGVSIDQHRPTIRVVPPTDNKSIIPGNNSKDLQRPTIRVQPTSPHSNLETPLEPKKGSRPTIRVVPPN